MGNCTIDNIEPEFVANAIRNHKQIVYIHPGMSHSQKAEIIRTLSPIIDKEYTIDDQKKVGVDEDSLFDKTVTQIINPRGKSKPNDKNAYTNAGDLIHAVQKDLIQDFIDDRPHNATYNKYKVLGLNDSMLNELKEIIDNIILEAQSYQDQINKQFGTNEKIEILSEQRIGSGFRSVAGKPDLIILFSNDTGIIYDFKSYAKEKAFLKNYYKYQAQILQYKRILKESYGISDILKTQLIPIKVKLNLNGQITSIKKQFIEEPDVKSKFMNGTYDKLGIKGVDEFLKQQFNEIRKLREKAKGEKDKDKQASLRSEANILEEAIKKFVATAKFDVIVSHITTVLFPQITNLLNHDGFYGMDTLEALNLIQGYTQSLGNYAGIVDNFKYFDNFEVPEEEKEAFNKQLWYIRGKSEELLNALSQVRNDLVLETIPDYHFEDSSRKTLRPFKKIGAFDKLFSRLSSIDNPIFKEFYNRVRKSRESINLDLRKFSKDLVSLQNKVESKLKSEGKTFKEVFIDTKETYLGKKNKNLGNYIHELSEEGSRLRLEAWEAAKEANDPKIYASTNPNSPTKINEEAFEEQFKKRLEKVYQQAIAKWGEDASSIDKEIDAFIEDFDILNSPKAFFEHGWRWCKLKPEFIAQHQSAEFQYIQSIPEFKLWYEFIESSNEQFSEMLGINDKRDLPSNFYPNVRKSILEKTLDNPLNVSEITNSWLDSLTVQEEDTFLGQLDANGDPIRKVPVMFVSKLAETEKSYNYGHATLLFAKMAFNHKHASDLEVFGQAYKAILSQKSKQFETDSEGNPIYDYAADQVTKNAKDIEQLFDKFLNMYVYGITTTDDLNRTIDIAGRKINATKAVKRLMNYDRMRALGLKFTTATAAFISSRVSLNALKKKNGAITQDLIEKSVKDRLTNRKKWLTITSILDATNEDFVNRTSSKHFFKGLRKYLDERTLFAPFRIGDQFHKDDIAYAMFYNYGLDAENNIRRLVNLPEGTKSLGESLIINETENMTTFTLGDLSEDKSLEIMESFRTITNRVLYRVTGTTDTSDTYAAQTSLLWQWLLMYKTWMPGIIGERVGKIKYDEITDTLEMPRYKAVAHWLGSSKEQRGLKKIVSQTLKGAVDVVTFGGAKRILYKDGNRVNDELAQIAFNEWRIQNPESADKVSLEDWKKSQEGQLAATFFELRAIAGIMTMLLIMGTDDEDEFYSYKNNYPSRIINKVLNRSLNEITYFYSPSSVTDLFSRAPLISLITDVTKMFTNTFDETSDIITGNNLSGEDLQDKTPPGYYTTKLIVGFSGLRSVADMIYEQDKALRK